MERDNIGKTYSMQGEPGTAYKIILQKLKDETTWKT
jgi:hypothetical protein